jgi:hypothetical protein
MHGIYAELGTTESTAPLSINSEKSHVQFMVNV